MAKDNIILDFEQSQLVHQLFREILDKMGLGGVEPPSH